MILAGRDINDNMAKYEAKRMIKTQSAVSVNGGKISDPNEEITPTEGMVIQVGKRKFAKLTIT